MTVVVIKNELFCSRGPARAIQTCKRCLSMHGRAFLHLLWLLSHVQNLLKLIIYAFKYVVSTSKSILEYCNIHTVYMSAGSLHKYLLLCRKKWVGVYWKMLYLCMRLLCDIWYRSYITCKLMMIIVIRILALKTFHFSASRPLLPVPNRARDIGADFLFV